ncbi:transposase [Streptomyces sp. NPDC057910]|uniref:transposase n=1 Tax=Streptomyces sp. NPDC057910 TaxID=3346278 RepID=UPI0036EB4808
MALVECGTHGLVGAAFDGVEHSSEYTLGRALPADLTPDVLLLVDRYFAGYELWADARATGAHLIWRVKKGQIFTPLRVLPDGSCLSIMPTSAETRRHARAAGRAICEAPQGHLVRIIEYTVLTRGEDGATRPDSFRLVTSLLDHRQAPARQIAMICHQRWEIENSFAEIKNRLRGAGFTLRSKSPRTRLTGGLRAPDRLPRAVRARVRERSAGRNRPRPDLLRRHRPARCPRTRLSGPGKISVKLRCASMRR